MLCLPYQGNYKVKSKTSNSKEMDEYEIVALAKRQGYTLDDMKEMSFVTLTNCLLSIVEEDSKQASQEDIDRFFG